MIGDVDALEALYDQVPDAGCRGLCQTSCGPLPMTVLEARRLRRAGHAIPHAEIAVAQLLAGGDYTCPALVDGRCSAYELRPLVCRLYGAAEPLPCPHGCAPAGGPLDGLEAGRLIVEVDRIGGGQR